MSSRKGETMAVRKHKEAAQAASCHQSVCYSQPLSGFHHRKQVGQWRSTQAVGLRMSRRERGFGKSRSGDARSMSLPGLLKGRSLIWLLRLPDGIERENARPSICQGSDRDGMALALGSFALIILLGPGFLKSTLPSKLLQGAAPGLDAAQASMRFLVRPALEEDGRGAGESLQAAGAVVAIPIITQFSQQARRETFASSRQGLEQLAVGMHQKRRSISLSYSAICLSRGSNWSTKASISRDLVRVITSEACRQGSGDPS